MQKILQAGRNSPTKGLFGRAFGNHKNLHNKPAGVKQPDSARLSELAALITNATKIVEAHHAKSTRPIVPPLSDTTEHPLDAGPSDRELRRAIQVIEGACAQLTASVGRPSHVMVNKYMSFFEPACIRVALDFKIADILEQKPEGMHISEIGEKSGIEAGKVGRVLRLLATHHVFREVSENMFANNRLSMQLVSRNPLSSLGQHFTEELYGAAAKFPDVFSDPEWSGSYAPDKTAFNKYTNYPDPAFSWYEGATPKGAEHGARFGIGMIGWGSAIEATAVIKEFPWKDLGPNASVCDVGGGIGNICLQLAAAYPTLQLKLQDVPVRIEQARDEVWPEKCPEAIAEGRIEFKAVDFINEAPIQGCSVYYLKNILHDWPDASCITILSNVKKAMTADSRVLIHEYILQGAYRVSEDTSTFTQAPEPLLPNYGAGRIRQYNLDLDMMALLNSQERRLEEFIKLGEAAGLKFVKLWDAGDMGLVEFRLQ